DNRRRPAPFESIVPSFLKNARWKNMSKLKIDQGELAHEISGLAHGDLLLICSLAVARPQDFFNKSKGVLLTYL
ncbi:MAG: hypothetical protein LBC94_00045, partial [Desulfovibrio sp.]|nr:hypothetical protein [Desulfovibrio sp.]